MTSLKATLLLALPLMLGGCLGASLVMDPAHPPVSLHIYVTQCLEPKNFLGRLLLRVPFLRDFQCQVEEQKVHAPSYS